MIKINSPVVLIGLGSWVVGVLFFALQPLPEITSTSKLKGTIYFSKPELSEECKAVYPRKREIDGISPALEIMTQLLRGPSGPESSAGYSSHIPPQTKLLSLKIEDGVAEANFSKTLIQNSDKCGYEGALEQITQTMKVLPKVKSVRILVDGLPAARLSPR